MSEQTYGDCVSLIKYMEPGEMARFILRNWAGTSLEWDDETGEMVDDGKVDPEAIADLITCLRVNLEWIHKRD